MEPLQQQAHVTPSQVELQELYNIDNNGNLAFLWENTQGFSLRSWTLDYGSMWDQGLEIMCIN